MDTLYLILIPSLEARQVSSTLEISSLTAQGAEDNLLSDLCAVRGGQFLLEELIQKLGTFQ